MITNFKKFLIENNLPTGLWVKATEEELEEYNDEIFDMINKAYKYLGGYPGFNKPEDVNFTKADDWEIIDLTGDGEPDAVSADKIKKHGKKYILGATDGNKESKVEYIKMVIKRLNETGHYIECSHKLATFLIKYGAPIVNNKENVEKILKIKVVEWLDNGWYKRTIPAGPMKKQVKTSILLGKPLVN